MRGDSPSSTPHNHMDGSHRERSASRYVLLPRLNKMHAEVRLRLMMTLVPPSSLCLSCRSLRTPPLLTQRNAGQRRSSTTTQVWRMSKETTSKSLVPLGAITGIRRRRCGTVASDRALTPTIRDSAFVVLTRHNNISVRARIASATSAFAPYPVEHHPARRASRASSPGVKHSDAARSIISTCVDSDGSSRQQTGKSQATRQLAIFLVNCKLQTCSDTATQQKKYY
jgi:hypothetical protein